MTLSASERETVESGGNLHIVIDGIPCVIVRADVFEVSCSNPSVELTDDELRGLALRAFEEADTAEAIKP